MRWLPRVGCVVLAVGVAEGVAGACGEEGGEEELVVVPRGGGVFVKEGWWESCRMLMVGGGKWVPLRAERAPRGLARGPAWGPVLYKPVRALERGVVYQVVAMRRWTADEEAACGYFGRAVAGAAADTRPPHWLLDPRVVSTGYRSGCLSDEAIVELDVHVADDSPVRLEIEARPRDGRGEVMRAVVRPSGGRARVVWPTRGERFLRAGADYEATVCATDAAGNRSCAEAPVEFTAPMPEPAVEPLTVWLAREVWRLKANQPEVVGPAPAPEERMERGRVPRGRVDWRCASAGAAGALLVLALAALARARRSARRRLSRTA